MISGFVKHHSRVIIFLNFSMVEFNKKDGNCCFEFSSLRKKRPVKATCIILAAGW